MRPILVGYVVVVALLIILLFRKKKKTDDDGGGSSSRFKWIVYEQRPGVLPRVISKLVTIDQNNHGIGFIDKKNQEFDMTKDSIKFVGVNTPFPAKWTGPATFSWNMGPNTYNLTPWARYVDDIGIASLINDT
jgi:hypothetical protein